MGTEVSPLTNAPRFIAKVVVDQSVGLPTVFAAFCVIQPVLQGRGLEVGLEKLRRDWTTMCVAGWRVWYPTIGVVFAAVPLHFRPLAINCVSLFWSMYVSSMGGAPSTTPAVVRGERVQSSQIAPGR